MRYACLMLACLLLVSTAAAEDKPATAPAVTIAKAKPAADLVKGAVDPYDRAAERARFFRAAGVDNELDAKEFAAARGAKDSFVRPFDKWEAILRHDKDGNGTIDWFEADAYRRGIRDRLMKAFDADKNGRLKGGERDKANAALASGRIPGGAVAKSGSPGSPGSVRRWSSGGGAGQGLTVRRLGQGGAGGWSYTRPEDTKKYDADGDGQLSNEERQAMYKAQREQWMTRRHDKDGDGKLDEAERAAMAAEQARWDEQRRKWREQAEQRRKEQLEKYDADRDGTLSNEERQAMYKAMREQWQIRRHDKDGDGKLNEAERGAMEAEQARRAERTRKWREQAEQRRKEQLEKHDVDGDGKLSDAERQAMYKAMRDQAQKRAAEMRERYQKMRKDADADGDGQTSGQEWRDFWQKKRKDADADGDGKLDTEERTRMMRDLYGDSYGTRWVYPGVGVSVGGVGVNVGGRPMLRTRSADGESVMTSEDGKTRVIIRRAQQD